MNILSTVPGSQMSVVWQTPYLSESTNRKMKSMAAGIVRGVNPVPVTGSPDTLRLNVDPVLVESVIAAVSDDYMMTWQSQSLVDLTIPSSAALQYVAFRATYAIGTATVGEFVVYSEAEIEAGILVTDNAVLICGVLYDGIDPIEYDRIWYSGQTSTTFVPFVRGERILNFGSNGRSNMELVFSEEFDNNPEARYELTGFTFDYSDYITGTRSAKFDNIGTSLLMQPKQWFAVKPDPTGDSPARFTTQVLMKFDAGYIPGPVSIVDLSILYESSDLVSASTITNAHVSTITSFSTTWRLYTFDFFIPSDDATYGRPMRVYPVVNFNGSGGGGTVMIDSIRVWRHAMPISGYLGYGDNDAPKTCPNQNNVDFSYFGGIAVPNFEDPQKGTVLTENAGTGWLKNLPNSTKGLVVGDTPSLVSGSRNPFQLYFSGGGTKDEMVLDQYQIIANLTPQSLLLPVGFFLGKADGTVVNSHLISFDSNTGTGLCTLEIGNDPVDGITPMTSSDFYFITDSYLRTNTPTILREETFVQGDFLAASQIGIKTYADSLGTPALSDDVTFFVMLFRLAVPSMPTAPF